MEYKYQIALSFAGEDREFVDQVANLLKEKGVSVFYDKFEQVDLWGKDLAIHFDYVYQRQSQYFIPFISKHYKEKIWTNYEVRNAMARAIENREEYILPVRFDDTTLDGIRSTIGYLDISQKSPEELANMIIQKLGQEPNIPLPEKEEPKKENSVYLTTLALVDNLGRFRGVQIGLNFVNPFKVNRYFNFPYFQLSQPLDGKLDTFQLTNELSGKKFPVKLEYGELCQLSFEINKGLLDKLRMFQGQKVTLTAHVTTTLGENYQSNAMDLDMLFI